MLDAQLRRRLIEALCARYPTQKKFEIFLSLTLDVELSRLSAPDGLPTMIFNVVVAAQARGWESALVEAAASDSPHSAELAAIRDVLVECSEPPVPVAAPSVDVAVIAPLGPLIAALRADPGVGAVAWFATAESAAEAAAMPARLPAADALVVSTAVAWPKWTETAVTSALRGRPVVLVEAREPRGAPNGPGVAPLLAERVTQIVVLDDPVAAVRRIVDHLSAIAHS